MYFLVAQASLEQTSYSVSEEDGTVNVCVRLVGSIERQVEVNLFAADGTATGIRSKTGSY